MARLIKVNPFVGRGEELAAGYLEAQLPGGWSIICNKELVDPRGTAREIDFIIVAQHTVFLVEEKSWGGPIHGNENGWVLRSGESYIDPLGKTEYLARRLAGMLRRNIPGLGAAVREQDHFVLGRIVLSSDDAKVFVHDPRVREQVLNLQKSAEALFRTDQQQANLASIAPFTARIVKALTRLPDRPKIPRRVGDYEVLESLDSVGPTRLLTAKHPDGSHRYLKLIRLPDTAIADQFQTMENALLREYEALRRLANSGVSPRVDPFFSWEEGTYRVVPIHPIEGESLRAHRTESPPTIDEVLPVVKSAFTALAAVHEAGVVHRSLTPDRIHLQRHNVIFSDFLIARIEGQETVAAEAPGLDPDNVYRAPECRVGLEFAVPASDVFSLAASLFYWITGYEPRDTEPAFPRLLKCRSELQSSPAAFLDEVFAQCLVEDEEKRLSARQVCDRITEEETRQQEESRRHSRSQVFQKGDIVEDRYEIRRVLGQGGTAITYLAYDQVADDLFVLKRILNVELYSELSRREFRVLRNLHHPNLPRVYDVYPERSPFHLKLEYVCGSSLKEVRSEHANVAACLRIGRDVLTALGYLADQGLVHRDVSPANILIPDEQGHPVKLIDFGLAAAQREATAPVGTPPYRAPEVEQGAQWSPSCDLYSLGIVLFELLVGRLPYRVEQDRRRKDELIGPSAEEERRCGRPLLRALFKAVSPDPSQRFPTAEAFLQAIEQGALGRDETLAGDEQACTNLFVDELRRAYRNSRIGNTNNRGLESDFSRETYVETSLDTALLPQILEGQFRLVILSGNPGDGKTAFLQQLCARLKRDGATAEVENEAGWTMRSGDTTFAALYDASESHKGRSADDLFHEILHPLGGRKEPVPGYVAGIAVNDGRLRDFFERNGTTYYPWLWDRLRPQLDDRPCSEGGVLLVDMKRRCLVGRDPSEPSLFAGILDRFLDCRRWEPCNHCASRRECPIWLNVQSLSHPSLAETTRRRLHRLVLAVHLRRERRATVRDLRSAIAFLITHDLGCAVVHEERAKGQWPLSDASRYYFNAAFDGSGSPDLLLDEWQQLDPALVPAPRLDRYLHFHRSPDQTGYIEGIFQSAEGRPALTLTTPEPRDRIAALKRRYAFEAGGAPSGKPQKFPEPDGLIPYRYLVGFLDAVAGRQPLTEVRDRLLLGISRADSVPLGADNTGLALRLTDASNGELVVIKKFPPDEFRIRIPTIPAQAVEVLTDYLILEHGSGVPRLVVGLDLFEYLCRSADGSVPGAEEQRALVEDLGIFKNQLLTRPTQEVLILEAGHRSHRVCVEDGRIVREEATT